MDIPKINLVLDWLAFIVEWLAAKQYTETSYIFGVTKLSLEGARQKCVTS